VPGPAGVDSVVRTVRVCKFRVWASAVSEWPEWRTNPGKDKDIIVPVRDRDRDRARTVENTVAYVQAKYTGLQCRTIIGEEEEGAGTTRT